MTSKVLVTGGGGFVGRHLLSAIAEGRFGRLRDAVVLPSGLDVRDEEALSDFVAEQRPDAVIHLAAQSFVPRAIENPRETYDINVIGTLNLIQALDAAGFNGRFLFVSSGDVYGRVDESSLPVDASTWPRPGNPYASSKLAAEEFCLQWSRRTGAQVLVARPFNHIGPGQSDRFVVSSLAHQVVAIKEGRQPAIIEVGDIDATRDFSDVRDVVSAYAAILEQGNNQARYIVASGVERSVATILRRMLELAGVSADIRVDPSRLRASEQRRMVADPSATTQETGWRPLIELDQTLTDILQSVRSQ
ncbi:GDP-mannose 4,6-dehydratase [Stenotrophomonas sp. CFBP8994]|uniref:GDP-mannose 4,6-dehydratase n=1 Tax=Stenotrophomonas sp. CFBP8994 TaxID=3096527 RepID=UPI002A6AD7FC|nr:GDP-mannose 4,6-dehydratase [Stenotrophomonas sp. CFBP8994]MDY0980255.1 GDP-mannose 4,6-dehydratase [Stenotrophomonas sp. CFBP8994]